MMNVPSNQPIKKESFAPLDKWGGKVALCQGDSPICFFIPLKKKKGEKKERKERLALPIIFTCMTDYKLFSSWTSALIQV